MIYPDAKKAATMILSKGDKSVEVKPEENIDPKLDAYVSVAEDVMGALESKSKVDLAKALQALCMMMGTEEEESDEEGFHL